VGSFLLLLLRVLLLLLLLLLVVVVGGLPHHCHLLFLLGAKGAVGVKVEGVGVGVGPVAKEIEKAAAVVVVGAAAKAAAVGVVGKVIAALQVRAKDILVSTATTTKETNRSVHVVLLMATAAGSVCFTQLQEAADTGKPAGSSTSRCCVVQPWHVPWPSRRPVL
jgi:hypothetical protein